MPGLYLHDQLPKYSDSLQKMVIEPYYVSLLLLPYFILDSPIYVRVCRWELWDSEQASDLRKVMSAAGIPTQISNPASRTMFFITSELCSLFSSRCVSSYFSLNKLVRPCSIFKKQLHEYKSDFTLLCCWCSQHLSPTWHWACHAHFLSLVIMSRLLKERIWRWLRSSVPSVPIIIPLSNSFVPPGRRKQ